mmetsp:Transcript_12791/g.29783  ORF Transcript_12791/g.29783 Transcript_12791/m.29783 type:complete len:93 (-) Transcript_12791:157-435(-)
MSKALSNSNLDDGMAPSPPSSPPRRSAPVKPAVLDNTNVVCTFRDTIVGADGLADGEIEGDIDGNTEGFEVGSTDGDSETTRLGEAVGNPVG